MSHATITVSLKAFKYISNIYFVETFDADACYNDIDGSLCNNNGICRSWFSPDDNNNNPNLPLYYKSCYCLNGFTGATCEIGGEPDQSYHDMNHGATSWPSKFHIMLNHLKLIINLPKLLWSKDTVSYPYRIHPQKIMSLPEPLYHMSVPCIRSFQSHS